MLYPFFFKKKKGPGPAHETNLSFVFQLMLTADMLVTGMIVWGSSSEKDHCCGH